MIAQEQGLIDLPIARSDDSRVKRRVCPDGKKALTYYTVLKYLTDEYFKAAPGNGRTHQIRVHLSHRASAGGGRALWRAEEGISSGFTLLPDS